MNPQGKFFSIWISIYKEIKEPNQGRKIDREERENTKYSYNSTNIRKKTCNLMWSHAQNDLIHCQIKDFHSKFRKTKI